MQEQNGCTTWVFFRIFAVFALAYMVTIKTNDLSVILG